MFNYVKEMGEISTMLAVTAAVAGRADAFIARCTRSSVLAGLLALILVTDRHRSCPLAAGLTDQRRTGAACSII